MKNSVNTSWIDGMAFEIEVAGTKMVIDATEAVGGKGRGPQPKPLMLAALGGCTAMDVISILKKMRVELKDLNIKVDGELSEEHPKQYISMHLTYEFTGTDLPMEKLKKAVTLSQDRYCGVSATYRKALELTHEIVVKEA